MCQKSDTRLFCSRTCQEANVMFIVLFHSFLAGLELNLHSHMLSQKTSRYRKIYYGEDDKGECVTVEEFIDGKFTKYLNNTGKIFLSTKQMLWVRRLNALPIFLMKSQKKTHAARHTRKWV